MATTELMAQVTFDFITEPFTASPVPVVLSTFWRPAWAPQEVTALALTVYGELFDASLIRKWSENLSRIPQIQELFGSQAVPFWRRIASRRVVP